MHTLSTLIAASVPTPELNHGFTGIRRTATFEYRPDATRITRVIDHWPHTTPAERTYAALAARPFMLQPFPLET